jgi:hypothetical protein
MDTKAQPIVIGKLLANALGLTTLDLKPCPFTMLTTLGGMEHATGQTIDFIFNITCEKMAHLFTFLF